MNTRLVEYVLVFDLLLSLMIGAFLNIPHLTIPSTPSYTQAQYTMGNITWTLAFPTLTLIPPFNILGARFPGLVIPGFTIFSFNWGFLAPAYDAILWLVWFFISLGDVFSFLISIVVNAIGLLTNVPYVGTLLTAFVFILNILVIFELLKWARGD